MNADRAIGGGSAAIPAAPGWTARIDGYDFPIIGFALGRADFDDAGPIVWVDGELAVRVDADVRFEAP